MKLRIPYMALVMILMSCERKEKPILPFDRGNVKDVIIEMSNSYEYQVFYSLDSHKVVKTVNRMDWDLAFSCQDVHILHVNNGRGVYVAPTGKTSLSEVKDTNGLKFYWGQPSLNTDSLAFGTYWKKDAQVFVVNLGTDNNGLPLGFIKCIPEIIANNTLKITFAEIESTASESLIIPKDSRYNFSYISLLNKKMVEIEPHKNTWDLVFMQYTKLLFENPYPITRNYLVVGALNNVHRVSGIAFDFENSFTKITPANIPDYTFYSNRDAIGFDWKWFDIGANSYTVNPSMNYIINLTDGFYYKLHFLDFYNDKGIKGYPRFEYQKL